MLRLETAQLETRTTSHGKETLSPPHARTPSPLAEGKFSALLRHAQAWEDRFEEQRRTDRREADELAERAGACHAAQIASLLVSAPASTFRPNKGFDEVPTYSGDMDQDWSQELQQLQSWAKFLGIPDGLLAQEAGGCRPHFFNQHFAGGEPPAFAAVVAPPVSTTFVKPYQGALLWSARTTASPSTPSVCRSSITIFTSGGIFPG